MKRILLVLVCGTLAGCDYTVPLVKTPAQAVDARLVGVWQQQKEGGEPPATLLVLPLGKTEYLVSFPAGGEDAMFARACPARAGERSLLQLEWFGTAKGMTPDGDGRVYQYAAYAIEGDTLTARLVNADHVKRDAKTAEELAQAMAAQPDETELYREPMVFKKAKP